MAPKRRSFADNATGSASGALCSEAECLNLARRNGICWGHEKQRVRGQPARQLQASRPTMTPIERLHAAAIKYAEASANDDAEYKRADDNLCSAAIRYAEGRERRPRASSARR